MWAAPVEDVDEDIGRKRVLRGASASDAVGHCTLTNQRARWTPIRGRHSIKKMTR
jgi:hypothetical protein